MPGVGRSHRFEHDWSDLVTAAVEVKKGWIGEAKGGFKWIELLIYRSGLYHYTFLKPIECAAQRVNST